VIAESSGACQLDGYVNIILVIYRLSARKLEQLHVLTGSRQNVLVKSHSNFLHLFSYLTGENLLFARSDGPYLIKTMGIGTMMRATQPVKDKGSSKSAEVLFMTVSLRRCTHQARYSPTEGSKPRTSDGQRAGRRLRRWTGRRLHKKDIEVS
jgi:hypothetical protein